MSIQALSADALLAQPLPDRNAYATGMLLDAQDFSAEQTYHRGRLARALAGLAGAPQGATLAGLRVSHQAEVTAGPNNVPAARAEELEVAPGLALDPLGRLVEVPRSACLLLQAWFTRAQALEPGVLLRAAYEDLGRFVSPRLAGTVLPVRAVVADVFLGFAACEVGLTPAFAAGPYDSLNALASARLRDAYQLRLVARTGLDDDFSGLPAALAVARPADEAARRNALQDAVLDAWPVGTPARAAAPQALDDLHPAEVHLARLFIPVQAGNPVLRAAGAPVVDNFGRTFLPSSGLLGQWA
jgi:hypothetical protein